MNDPGGTSQTRTALPFFVLATLLATACGARTDADAYNYVEGLDAGGAAGGPGGTGGDSSGGGTGGVRTGGRPATGGSPQTGGIRTGGYRATGGLTPTGGRATGGRLTGGTTTGGRATGGIVIGGGPASCPDEVGEQVPLGTVGTTRGRSDFYTAGNCSARPWTSDFTLAFTAPLTGIYEFATLGSNFDTVLALLDGWCDPTVMLGCNDDRLTDDGSPDYDEWASLSSELRVALTRGQTVTAVVDGYDGDTGDYNLSVYRQACPQLSIVGTQGAISDDTRGHDIARLASCGQATRSPDFAISFNPPLSGRYAFDTHGSRFDTVLAIRSGTCGGDELACNDDDAATDSVDSRLVYPLDRNVPVTIVVSGFEGDSGTFLFHYELLD